MVAFAFSHHFNSWLNDYFENTDRSGPQVLLLGHKLAATGMFVGALYETIQA